MKILRIGPAGEERPAIMDAAGKLYDISHIVPDITPETLAAGCLETIAGLNVADLPPVEGAPRIGPPVNRPQKFIGVGLNYIDHATELGLKKPAHPVIFTKHTSCICGPNDDVLLPPDATHADHEIELGVVIGRVARRVSENDAMEHVAGYLLVNDISERHFQFDCGGQWVKGKSLDTFGPIGPWLATPEDIPDPHAIDLELKVNGEVRQRGNTKDMFYSVAELIAHISRFFTLMPGDIITTGTPSGVGAGMKPPRYLRDGDVMELSATGLGTQRQRVRRLDD
jgi:ureidoglycolate lyase